MGSSGSISLGWKAIRRRLVSQPATVLAIFTATLLAALILAAGPRMLEQVSSEDLRATVTDPDPAQRNIRMERSGRIGAGPVDEPFLPVARVGEAFAERDIPPVVSSVIADQLFVVDSPQFVVSPLPGEQPPHPFPTFFTYRYQEGIDDHMTLVEGTFPGPQPAIEELIGMECPIDPEEVAELKELLTGEELPEELEELDCTLEEVPHFQVAVTAKTAEDMGLEIGRLMMLRPDPRDPLFFGLSGAELGFGLAVSISGIIELSDPADEYWYGDLSLHRPRIRENADFRDVFATGLMSPEDYSAMLSATGSVGRLYTWRHYVDPDLMAEAELDVLQAELAPFLLEFSPLGARPNEPRVITQLDRLLATHELQRDQTVALLSVAVAGVFTVVVAVVGLLAVLMADRHRSADVLMRNRGASGGQLTMTGAYEGLLLAAPAGVVGYLLVEALFPETDSLMAYRVTVALVTAVVAAVVVAGLGVYWRRLGSLQTPRPVVPRSGPRRVVVEVFTLTLAFGAVTLLRRRGGVDDTMNDGSFDLLLAIAPALIAVASGLVLLRVYPIVIKGFAWVGSKMSGLVAFVGFRRVLQQPLSGRLGVVVILICVSIATYTAVLRTTIDVGQVESSWQAVGADYAVKGPSSDANLPQGVDLETLREVGPIAAGLTFVNARVTAERAAAPTEALTLDMPAYREVTAGTAGEIDLPDFLFAQPTPLSGTSEAPIPAIVSSQFAGLDLAPGDVFTLALLTADPVMVVREVRDSFPDIDERSSFVVFALNQYEAFNAVDTPRTVLYIKAGADKQGQLAADLATEAPSARLISRYDYLADLQDDPFIAWASTALATMFVSAAAFAVVAALASLAIASSRRRRDFGYLRTMGLEPRQTTWLTIIEQVPAAAIGTLVGVLVGVATIVLLGPAVRVDEFTGGLVPVESTIDWTALAALGLAIAAALAGAIVIFVLVNRREQLSRILRIGDEP